MQLWMLCLHGKMFRDITCEGILNSLMVKKVEGGYTKFILGDLLFHPSNTSMDSNNATLLSLKLYKLVYCTAQYLYAFWCAPSVVLSLCQRSYSTDTSTFHQLFFLALLLSSQSHHQGKLPQMHDGFHFDDFLFQLSIKILTIIKCVNLFHISKIFKKRITVSLDHNLPTTLSHMLLNSADPPNSTWCFMQSNSKWTA